MGNANSNSLNLKFFGIDVTVTFFVLVAGAKEISALGIVEAEDFQVVESPIKCNDNVTDLCGVLLADHQIGRASCRERV